MRGRSFYEKWLVPIMLIGAIVYTIALVVLLTYGLFDLD
jgi:hypothetical protein